MPTVAELASENLSVAAEILKSRTKEIIVHCTSTTRPTEADPGQHIYETDTSKVLKNVGTYDSPIWEIVPTMEQLGVVNVKDYGASGDGDTTTTGSIEAGSKTLTVASAATWKVGHGILVTGAGTGGADLVTKITAIDDTVFMLQDNAESTVSNASVYHNDTVAIQAAIDAVSDNGKVVFLPGGTYRFTSTLNIPSGVKLAGIGWHYFYGGEGTKLLRNAEVVGIKIEGEKIGEGGAHLRSITLEGLEINGGDYNSDLIQIFCADFCDIFNCRICASTGRGIYAREWMDSRVVNCYFTWIGSSDGSLPAVELNSGEDGYEYTNQIHFLGCDFEQCRGTSLSTTGTNTNEIMCTNCKFEAIFSNQPLVVLNKAVAIFLMSCTFTTKGDADSTICQQLKISDTSGVVVRGFFEHVGTPGEDAAYLTNFISVDNSPNVDITGVFASGVDALVDDYCVKTDGQNAYSHWLRGFITGTNPNNKRITNLTHSMVVEGLHVRRPGESTIVFSNALAGNDYFYLGRVMPDGDGARWRLIHQHDGTEKEVFVVLTDSSLKVRTPLLLGSGLKVSSAWDSGNLLQLGDYYLWVDATGDLRIKAGAPTSDTDGVVVGTQS